MSTNKTQNYQLHSWVKEDTFLMSEMNENFTTLDGKLHEEVTALDGQVKAEAQTRTQQLAQKADKTEVAAVQSALASEVQKLNTTLGAKADTATVTALDKTVKGLGKWVTGTYMGGIQSVDLGAPILCLHLEDDLAQRPGQHSTLAFGGLILPGYPLAYGCASVSGSVLTLAGNQNGFTSMVSAPGRTFHYAALLAQE